jgi:membrane-bound lytic murein transglycosylase D
VPVRVASAAPPPRGAAALMAANAAPAARAAPGSLAAPPVAALATPSGPHTRGGRSAADIAAEAAAYVVHGGDTLAMIAVQTGVDPETLMHINGLRDSDHIYEGQRLVLTASAQPAAAETQLAAQAVEEERQDAQRAAAVAIVAAHTGPVVNAAQAQAQGPTLLADSGAPPSADPIDYSVDSSGRVVVVAAETIGHYADWLGVQTESLRVLNGMHRRSNVLMGRRFKLAFTKVTREQFEQRRREYHQQLESAYFAAHRIIGSDAYVARRGDSLWSVTRRGDLPVWLLQQYNPDVDFAELRPGTHIVLPKVEDAS